MTKHKHTPAPWAVDESRHEGAINRKEPFRHIGMASIYQSAPGDREENEANAKLIAAAPDLLTALEEVSASLAWVALGQCRAMEDPPIMPPEMAIELARAAIAKATA